MGSSSSRRFILVFVCSVLVIVAIIVIIYLLFLTHGSSSGVHIVLSANTSLPSNITNMILKNISTNVKWSTKSRFHTSTTSEPLEDPVDPVNEYQDDGSTMSSFNSTEPPELANFTFDSDFPSSDQYSTELDSSSFTTELPLSEFDNSPSSNIIFKPKLSSLKTLPVTQKSSQPRSGSGNSVSSNAHTTTYNPWSASSGTVNRASVSSPVAKPSTSRTISRTTTAVVPGS